MKRLADGEACVRTSRITVTVACSLRETAAQQLNGFERNFAHIADGRIPLRSVHSDLLHSSQQQHIMQDNTDLAEVYNPSSTIFRFCEYLPNSTELRPSREADSFSADQELNRR
jgi:hypothetical protein